MRHPVFDSIRYNFALKEAADLYNILCQAFFNAAEIDTIYQKAGGDPGAININQAPDLIWKEALQKLAIKSNIKRLCDNLKPNAAQQLLAAIAALENVPSAIDPKNVDPKLLVLDRGNLRSQIDLLADEDDPVKVVLVKGDPKTGKSYSRHLFQAMAKQLGAETVFFNSVNAVVIDIVFRTLAKKIDSSVTIDIDHQKPNSTPDAVYSDFCYQLLDAARKYDKKLWIAVDDLGTIADNKNSVIKDFFTQFVSQLSDQDFRDHFRLMLINYPTDKIPPGWFAEHYTLDTTQDITETHICDAIRSWYAANKLNLLEDWLKDEAQKILDDANQPPQLQPGEIAPPKVQRIMEAVKQRMNKPQF